MYLIETERLLLRKFLPEDAEGMYEMNNDPDVIKYTGDPPFQSVEDAQKFIENYKDYKSNGYGRYTVLIKELNNAYAGWCGLKYHADINETDVGFRLMKKYWNKGIATEAAQACLEYGFNDLGLHRIIAHALKVNTASIRVLQKIGMEYWKDELFDSKPGVFYKIEIR